MVFAQCKRHVTRTASRLLPIALLFAAFSAQAQEQPAQTSATEVDVLSAPVIDSVVVSGEGVEIAESTDEIENVSVEPTGPIVRFGDWLGYNSSRGKSTWLAGDDFGMYSMDSFPTLEVGDDSALMVGMGLHFLNGPKIPDMPPRLFDVHTAYHIRKAGSARTFFDVKFGVGAFTDFEGSSRSGIRYPGHAVAYHEWSTECVSVFGIDYLDRDDISVLPVAGFVWRPKSDLILEMVFPRPRVQVALSNNKSLYLNGELGGGTWSIKRSDTRVNDTVTYRDFRIAAGIIDFTGDTDNVLEIGWAFDRQLEYRSTIGNTEFDDALILNWRTHF